MTQPAVGPPRGVLHLGAGERKLRLALRPPALDLAPFVAYYWFVKWDLRGQEPHRQENLPHPCVHLVTDGVSSRVFGVVTGKFSYLLEDRGRVFGVKFKPGAFYPFVKAPVSGLTDTSLDLQAIFGTAGQALEAALLARADDEGLIAVAEGFLRERLPERDENLRLIDRIIERISADRAITKVDDVASRLDLNKRTLQRLFNHYVGVNPKWVIQRYRLHDAVDQLAGGAPVDWPKLALDLGYCDQAHFIKDFKTIVGQSPAEYARTLGS